MTPERWRQIDQLLEAALDLPPQQRVEYLTHACAGDAELRADVEAVLRAHEQSGGFLSELALTVLAKKVAAAQVAMPEALSQNAHETPSLIGSLVSHYRILEKLGSGGMGVVYKAADIRLGRTVALKFLSEEYATDSHTLERFQREARVVAALDHPNICTVYDIGEQEGRFFIVMQLLTGEPLSDRIVRGPLSIDEVTDFGIELADALEKAHQLGIIHRDLKPGNIFITKDKRAKVLDFGLAKWSSGIADLSGQGSPAERHSLTDPGVAVGTVAYMSPEQARGMQLDQRTDLFSFGAVLYEMVTGRPAFPGRQNAAILDGVLNKAPVSPVRLNPEVPLRLEEIIVKALEKDQETRYQSAAELRADLKRLKRERESANVSAAAGDTPRFSRRFKWAVPMAMGITVVIILAAILTLRPKENSAPTAVASDQRLRLFLTSSQEVSNPELSPDGKTIVYVASDQGQSDIFVSRAAGGERLQVTNDVATEYSPKFSPDGERILFVRRMPGKEAPEICTTGIFGGETVSLVSGLYPAWSPDGTRFVFVRQRTSGLRSLAVADINGGAIRDVMEADSAYSFFYDPTWSPDGLQIAVRRSTGGYSGEIWVVPAKGGASRRVWQEPPGVFSQNPVFTPDGTGIVHSSNRGGATNLWVMFLDGRAPVRLTTGAGPDESPSIANDGTIAFSISRYRQRLVLYDLASGKTQELLDDPSVLWAPSFSPDGDEVAVSRSEPDGSWHIWLVPLTGGPPRRLTSGKLPEIYPRFTPDGKFVIYFTLSTEPDRIWKIPRAGGQALPVTPIRNADDTHGDISYDGRSLAFARTEGGTTRLYVAPLEGGAARMLTKSSSTVPTWSPDGRWIAFSPDVSWTSGVFIIGADGFGERRITQTGGWPVWLPDGKRIGYVTVKADGNQEIQTVAVAGGTPSPISELRFDGNNYPFDVSTTNRLVTTNQTHFSTDVWLIEPRR